MHAVVGLTVYNGEKYEIINLKIVGFIMISPYLLTQAHGFLNQLSLFVAYYFYFRLKLKGNDIH